MDADDVALPVDAEASRSLAGRFWRLWLSMWSAWCEPFDLF